MIKYVFTSIYTFVFLFFLCTATSVHAQKDDKNLVQNPSFETSDDGLSWELRNRITRAKYWTDPNNGGSLLYTTTQGKVYDPNGGGWPFEAHTGKNVAGMNVYGGTDNSPTREYIQGTLKKPLIVGRTYKFTFYVHYHCEGANNIGIAFLADKVQSSVGGLINLIPVAYQKEVCKYKTGKWEAVEGEFVAAKPYQHFVIGNFFSNKETQVEAKQYRHYFAYIDDISVTLVGKDDEKPIVVSEEIVKKWEANDETAKKQPVVEAPKTVVEEPVVVKTVIEEKPTPLPVAAKRLTLLPITNINFLLNSADLDEASKSGLDQLAQTLRDVPDAQIEITGHTCNNGSEADNMLLSYRRAQTVGDYLISKGVQKSQLYLNGYGEERPLVPNVTDENRAKNRRASLSIIKE